jgi:serine/threonine protein phosphatase PrpC
MISFANKSIEVYGTSIKYFQKEKNGDNFIIRDFPEEKIIVLIVADGISGQPCDWLASEMACFKFIEHFSFSKSVPLNERMKDAVVSTNKEICQIDGKCSGLASTISLVMYEYEQNKFQALNAGDSRIYKITNRKELVLLTKDDATKLLQEVVTSMGKRNIVQSYLTNHLGRSDFKVNIQEGSIEKGELLLLATDGFYDARKSSFSERTISLYNSINLEKDYSAMIDILEFSAKDDMTGVLLRQK